MSLVMNAEDEIVQQLREEADEDYVGLWRVGRMLEDRAAAVPSNPAAAIVSIVARLLDDPEIAIGQFRGGHFEEWQGTAEERLDRVQRELAAIGSSPDIGEVAWFTKR